MNQYRLLSFIAMLFAAVNFCRAQDMPKMAPPQKEHEWLQQLVGQWDAECEFSMGPGQPQQKSKASETVSALGGFWILANYSGDMMGQPFNGVMTLGFEPQKNKYVGTWIDSSNSYLWVYDGTLGADGKTLTLESQGPCPMLGGKMMSFKDVMEVKDKDHRVFTGSMQGEDGKWMTLMTITYERKQ